jgi:hypothetical protein
MRNGNLGTADDRRFREIAAKARTNYRKMVRGETNPIKRPSGKAMSAALDEAFKLYDAGRVEN